MARVTLTVNGEARSVDAADPEMPLLWVLRDRLGLWALSCALKGEITIAAGRVAETGFAEYPLLALNEMPELETVVVPSSAAPAGVGEMPVPAVAPAVANALFAATGRRLRRLPIRPADLV
ncbi:MAG TPA: hypothetical protein VMN82_17235 [Thermoanaerobaculia bacterium]|nr:hypothetical protein [Thermoanaerobaculia bacterium]